MPRFSSEQGKKGQIKAGQLADLVVLSKDYFRVPEEEIKGIESVLTVVGGEIVYAAGRFGPLAPPAIPVLPEWSPVVNAPGHYRSAPATGGACGSGGGCASLFRAVWGSRSSARYRSRLCRAGSG